MINTYENIQLVSDIEFIEQDALFNRKNYLLGSPNLNSYIKMNLVIYNYAKIIIDLIKQEKSLEEINLILTNKFPNQDIKVSQFIEKLKSAGLIKGFEKSFDDEMQCLGVTVYEKQFTNKKVKINLFLKLIYYIFSKWFIVLPILIISLLSIYFTYGFNVSSISNNEFFNFIINALVLILLSIFVFIFHELGHFISAINNKVRPKTFTISFYFGIFPIFYFRYNNFKVVSSKVKFKVIIAGIYVNIILAIISFLLACVFNGLISAYLYRFAILNILMFVANILPIKISDGYFLMSLLFNKFDIRLSIWRNIFKTQNEKVKMNLPMFIYFIISFLSILVSIILIILKIISYFHLKNYVYGYGLTFFSLFGILVAIVNIFIKFKGVKLMKINIIKQRIKIKRHRNSNLSKALVVLIFVFLFFTANSLVNNTNNYDIEDYLTNTGNADIIVSLSSSNDDSFITKDSNDYVKVFVKNDKINKINISLAYGNIKKINEKFNLSLKNKEFSTNEIIANVRSGLNIGDNVTINSTKYKVKEISENINYFNPNSPVILINSDNFIPSLNNYLEFIFAQYEHNQFKVENIIKELDNKKIKYINQFEGYNNIVNQNSRKQTVIYGIILGVFIICILISYSFFFVSVKNNSEYWNNLRLIGLSQKSMKSTMYIENLLYCIISFLLGIFLAVIVSKIICNVRNMSWSFYITIPNTIICALLAICISWIPLHFFIKKNKNNSALKSFEKVTNQIKKRKVSNSYIRIFIGIILFLAIIFAINFYRPDISFSNMQLIMVFYFVIFVISLIDLIILTTPLLNIFQTKIGKIIKNKYVALSGLTFKISSKQILTITLAIIMWIVFITSLNNLFYSTTMWGYNTAKEQMTFDGRATTENIQSGITQINNLINDPNIELQSEYYENVGKLSMSDIHILSETKASNDGLQKIYGTSKPFSVLNQNEIAINRFLATSMNLKIGSQINIYLNNVEKNVKVAMFFDTADYDIHLAVVSPKLFMQNSSKEDYSEFKNICINFNLKNNQSLNNLKNNLSYDRINFQSKNDLIEYQKNGMVNGMEMIYCVFYIILATLVFIIFILIKKSIIERKRDFAILRSIGLNKAGVFKLIFTELFSIVIPIILFSIIFVPIASYNFINGFCVMYGIWGKNAYVNDWITEILMLGITSLVILLAPIKSIFKTKKQSIMKEINSNQV